MSMDNWYPTTLNVNAGGSLHTLRFLAENFARDRAFCDGEFGIYQAATAEEVLKRFPKATVYLFDFDHTIDAAKKRLSRFRRRVHGFGNTTRHLDSYNWPLMKLIARHKGEPLFDYIYLDGAHTVAVDALTFFLGDRLLRVGGYVEFDDYRWRLRGSSLDPSRVPVIAEQYTDEQIDAYQVKMIVDHLVMPDPRYRAIAGKRIFQKVA